MFSEKQFLEWQGRRGELEDRERQRIRSEVEAEVNATCAIVDREREAKAGREAFARTLGRESATRMLDQPGVTQPAGANEARRAQIRQEVERDVRTWEAQQAQQARQTRG